MNDRETLSHVVQHQFEDKTPALMLVDMLMDDYFMTKREALKDAARLRKSGRDAHYLAEACALLAKGSPLKKGIEELIRSAGSHSWRASYTIMVIPGYAYPHPVRRIVQAQTGRYWRTLILVGARRVLWIAQCVQDAANERDYPEYAPDGDLINH